MVLFVFFPPALLRLVFRWNPDALAWSRPGLPQLCNLAGPLHHFKAAIFLMLGVMRLLLTFVARRVFEVGLCWISMAPCSSLILLVFEKEIRLSFVAPWLGVFGMGFSLLRVRSQVVPCRFCGAPDSDGHLFWECTFPPLVEMRENPEFHDLMRMDKGHWSSVLALAWLASYAVWY